MLKTVNITEIDINDDIKHLESSLYKLLDPFKSFLESLNKKVVLLKPNVMGPFEFETGVTTNPYLVRALVNIILEYNPKKIFIADGSAVGHDTKRSFEVVGYTEIFADLVKDNKVVLRDLKGGSFIKKDIPDGILVKELRIPKLLEEIETIINIPVPKTHDALPITLGIKNMKGIIHENIKKEFHRIGLSQAIVDLIKLVYPDFTIYDATVAMEGQGPAHGTPVHLKHVLAAKDVVAGDRIMASIMGFNKNELKYLKLAESQDLGEADLDNIRVLGKKIDRPFSRYSVEEKFYEKYNIKIIDKGSCSGCRNTLDGIIKNDEVLNKLKNKTIYLGPTQGITTSSANSILLGSCLHNLKDKGYYIKGCPPHSTDIINFKY